MNKKLRVVNSYRLTQIDKYIAERKEEYINCKNKSNISSFHYEKLIDDIEKILRSFPDEEFISLYYDDENINNKIHDISETLNETYNDRTKLRNENTRLNNIIKELEKDLYKIRELTFNKYNSNEWNNCLSFNDDILPVINRLKELKGEDKE